MVRSGEEGGADRDAGAKGVFHEQIAQPKFDRGNRNLSRFHELAMIATTALMFVSAGRSLPLVGRGTRMLMPPVPVLFVIMAAVAVIRRWFKSRAAVVRVVPAAAKKGVQQHHGKHGDCGETSRHENTPGSDEDDATGGFETGQSRFEARTITLDRNVQLRCQNELTPLVSVFPRLSRARRCSPARNRAKNTRRVTAH